MALVVTLLLVVLVTIAVMAFFARATSNRIIEVSRANQVLSSQVSDSATDYVIGQFLQEIAAHSATTTANDIPVFHPTTNTFAVPQKIDLPGANKTNFANHLRRSVNETTNGVGEANASTHSTAAVSANGRSVGTNRWNAPRLISGAGFDATNQLPNWIYLNKNGSVTNTPTTNAIGRFAYNVYNIGGLLDANVAGFPSSVTSDPTNLAILKGSVAGADLGVIPGVTNANAFVSSWRNANSVSSAASYVNAVTNAASGGFLRPSNNDQRFQSRQDLIALARTGNRGITAAALPYLTTFTRAPNAPSWSPQTPTNSSLDYAASCDAAASKNRFLPNVRASDTFPRADGTTAQAGESLIKTRFPLSRLAGIGPNGVNTSGNTTMMGGVPAPATAATIQRDFGLVWSGDRWTYVGSGGSAPQSTIKTLAQVTSENREPNFFELLQAAILEGSVGKTIGPAPAVPISSSTQEGRDADKGNHIIQIGVNLVDQYDANSYPTRIRFGGNDFAGVENIPYLTRVLGHHYRPTTDASAVSAYLLFEVWNPHSPRANTDAPTNFRVAAEGRLAIAYGSVPAYKYLLGNTWLSTDSGQPEFTATASATYGANGAFHNPTLLTPDVGATASDPNNVVNDVAVRFVGRFAGRVVCSDSIGTTTTPHTSYGGYHLPGGTPGVTFYMQYRDGGNWVSYQARTANINAGDKRGNRPAGDPMGPAICLSGFEPRSQRFGFGHESIRNRSITPPWMDQPWSVAIGRTARPNSSSVTEVFPAPTDGNPGTYAYGNALGLTWFPPLAAWGPGWGGLTTAVSLANGSGILYRTGFLAENNTTLANGSPSPLYYRDNDNILRRGDAAYASGSWGQPLDQDNPSGGASRPIMLDRPFRSVGEMGYAFRDLPFKSLDFFTAESADAALLDVFSVAEGAVSGVTAGVLDLNTRQQPVLKALLAGALKDEMSTSSGLAAATEADAIATAMIAVTDATPLLNRSDLATRVSPALAPGTFANNPADSAIKARRESVVRALADAGQTRTWNVLADVIAQSGRFVQGTAEENFLVESEQRVWLSAAIDRYLGRVVAERMEVVNE